MATASRHRALRRHSSESLEQIAVHCLERKPHHHRLLWLCHQILFERILRASAPSPAGGTEPKA